MKHLFDRNEQWVTVLSQDDLEKLQRKLYAMSEYLLDLMISRKIDIGRDPTVYDEEPLPERILF